MEIHGAVQGVGFRPFIYRLADSFDVTGWVCNTARGVILEVEGEETVLLRFGEAVEKEKPAISIIQDVTREYLEPVGYNGFEIRKSTGGERKALVLPDISTCDDCLEEIMDPENRRYRYPFTNCTNCGPRYSIINSIPYDRPATTMAGFHMCKKCLEEYESPSNRRFHAQPNACPECGPHLELWDHSGIILAERNEALKRTASAILDGKIVAVKGLGGFHLITLASSDKAVLILRERKGRKTKPFALMFPSSDMISSWCELSEMEQNLLRSPESPIVLLKKRENHGSSKKLSDFISPGNPDLGVMLPYTPLHHLLLQEIGEPVVATSGNLSDEPICTDEKEALRRLSGLADLFLIHNRPIARHVDDSIVRVVDGREMVLRRARGYAPLPLRMNKESDTIMAAGAHLKNTLALSIGNNVFISQHIGDMETPQAVKAYKEVWSSIELLYHAKADKVIYDMHPDYISTKYAVESGLPVFPVQHHVAHVFSCMLDNGLNPPLLGVSWDGTGYGTDGTIWGGEFFYIGKESVERVAHMRTFRLPGGEKAIREPKRAALGLLSEMFDDPAAYIPSDVFSKKENIVLKRMLKNDLNSPSTSSAGRLFDVVASMLGLCQTNEFEGQAAMLLEYAVAGVKTDDSYHLLLDRSAGKPWILDWESLINDIIKDITIGEKTSMISARFHNALAEGIVSVAELTGEKRVVLSGGCFQNVYLTERTADLLRKRGFTPVLHRKIPPNDGGIAPGQIFAAVNLFKNK
ncbi:MAG: carbamoyltransferase HypF [Candidatus Aegiribacteria sp.]|nr:carbamoyltransferase HypF [Candidatus Aegiribacteria sp.]